MASQRSSGHLSNGVVLELKRKPLVSEQSHIPPKKESEQSRDLRPDRSKPHVRYANYPRDYMGKHPSEVTPQEIAEHKKAREGKLGSVSGGTNSPNAIERPFETKKTETSTEGFGNLYTSLSDIEPTYDGYPTHSKYVSKFHDGEISVFVDRSVACKICDKCLEHETPSAAKYKRAKMWFHLHLGAAILPWFFMSWGWALLCSISLGLYSILILAEGVRQSAISTVIETSLMDSSMYGILVSNNWLGIKDKNAE